MNEWNYENVSRGNKCFSPQNNGYPGGYPVGYLSWLQSMGWWGDKRLHVPCGAVADDDSIRVDIKSKGTNATNVFDGRSKEEMKSLADTHGQFNWIGIDPPYSAQLADDLYGTLEHFSSINAFTDAAYEALEPGGLIVTLSYEVPKRIRDCNLIAAWGIYQAISVSHMRCLNVWQKPGKSSSQGLERWTE